MARHHRQAPRSLSRRAAVVSFTAFLPWAGCTEVPRNYDAAQSPRGELLFADDFERGALGVRWRPTGPGAEIVQGALKIEDIENHPLWLDLRLPPDLRVEFDAWAGSEEGDVKIELAGDGESHATSLNYTATGYVLIFGGWNNSLNAIVRRNEHGRNRSTVKDPRVIPDRRYRMAITRIGPEIRWEIDGREILVYEDPRPLTGKGHEFFAFSGWQAPTFFDNLRIEAL